MANCDDIVSFCEELLNVAEVADPYCENGLQVEGSSEVKKIALGVSSSAAFLEQAVQWKADMCVMHHGLFWSKGTTKVTGVLKKRLQLLLENDISLVTFHIPLDAHPEIGNNAAIVDLLGLKNQEPVSCGFIAEFEQEMFFAEFEKLVREKLGRVNFAENFSLRPVKRVGVISGGSAGMALQVKQMGADTFLFGEMREHDYHDLKEMELSFVAAGHFATERCGIQRLGEKIAAHFSDVEVQFFDEECPI